jgi:hypothetical protein
MTCSGRQVEKMEWRTGAATRFPDSSCPRDPEIFARCQGSGRTSSGEVRVVSTAMDITERKQTEFAIQQHAKQRG